MAVMDEFREERKSIKQGTLKQKLEYFWGYYKWDVIIWIVALSLVVVYVHTIVTRKDTAFYALFINNVSLSEDNGESYVQKFADHIGIDTDKYEVTLDNSVFLDLTSLDEETYASTQRINTLISVGEVDILGADIGVFKAYAYLDYMTDLRTVLSPEQLETYSPYFFYVDREVMKFQEEARSSQKEVSITYPDHTKPEEMQDPVPVGILLDNVSEEFTQNYMFSDTTGVIGFVKNARHMDTALIFLDYIFAAEQETSKK